jgi:hypothetical protein
VSGYREAPHIHRGEQRCTNHLGPSDDVEALVIEAKETKLDRAYHEHMPRSSAGETGDSSEQLLVRRGIGQVLGVC